MTNPHFGKQYDVTRYAVSGTNSYVLLAMGIIARAWEDVLALKRYNAESLGGTYYKTSRAELRIFFKGLYCEILTALLPFDGLDLLEEAERIWST